MQIWIALLKGVNVGGRNKLPMKLLVSELESAGLSDVKAYIQSGNLVFRSPRTKGDIASQIANTIEEKFAFRPHVVMLSYKDLVTASEQNPFSELTSETDSKLVHFFFLSEAPAKIDIERLERVRKPTERYKVDGAVFYLHTPDGFGDSKLAIQVEKILAVTATARNLRTVRTLLDLSQTDR
jgi:uncharacterized protein (DUF1697 family)